MFLHSGSGRAARRPMNPAATDTKPAEAGYHGREPASAGLVLPAAGFSPPACRAAAGLSVTPCALAVDDGRSTIDD